MTKIWYCRNCGYEVTSRGRCHSCREKLIPSSLPQLDPLPDEDEVGYDIEGWSGRDRGRLIEGLNDLGVIHRFEEEELVVDSSDEARVDDLVAALADGADVGFGDGELDDLAGSDAGTGSTWRDGEGEPTDPLLDAAVRLLADAASRLKRDPTDMQADADVAEASAAVFIPDRYGPLDEDTWTAVGRVTRKLLSLLGAEEALDEQIRSEAAVLEKLLAPVPSGGSTVTLGPEGAAALGGETNTGEAAGSGPEPVTADSGTTAGDALDAAEKTVYELPEWLPEQRAQLGVFLDDAGIAYEWEGGELIVPAERETEVEELFGRVSGVDVNESDEDDETRYQAVAELFAACGRLASEPADRSRREAVVEWIHRSSGPPLFGMDEVDWFRIASHARTLETAIDTGEDPELISREADALHEMLRALV